MSSDKFMIIKDQPYMHPNKCASCNTQKITEYVDFGLNIPRYGRVYFCIDCLNECFTTLNTTVPVSQLQERFKELEEENVYLSDLITRGIADLKSYLAHVYPKPEVDESIQYESHGSAKRGPGRPKRSEQGTT